jgi:hypothetical protein
MTSERPKEPHGGFGERRKPQPLVIQNQNILPSSASITEFRRV